MAKRGSYFQISKGRAKTRFASILTSRSCNYLELNNFISKPLLPHPPEKFNFFNHDFFKARYGPTVEKKFVPGEHFQTCGSYLLSRYCSCAQDAHEICPHDVQTGGGQQNPTRDGDYSPFSGDQTKSAPGPLGTGADFGKKRKLFSN